MFIIQFIVHIVQLDTIPTATLMQQPVSNSTRHCVVLAPTIYLGCTRLKTCRAGNEPSSARLRVARSVAKLGLARLLTEL
jgi:hypothetical protein